LRPIQRDYRAVLPSTLQPALNEKPGAFKSLGPKQDSRAGKAKRAGGDEAMAGVSSVCRS